ncbi:MAG: MerR family transcriptional regulator [Ruminococcus sp.]|nr:MerR family transcriptional regulator [Ruminococcus sp.]
MRTVNDVSRLTGVSIRTLQYYDRIGLLPPAQRTEAGYRLYDDTALERLQQILLFRELGFSLDEIKDILDSPGFDRGRALTQQIELLMLKKQRLEAMIALAREIREKGEKNMSFEAFDNKKIEEYAARAKAEWGGTREFAEYEQKSAARTPEQEKAKADELMRVFAEFGAMRDKPVDSAVVREQVRKLQRVITENYYTCTDEILASLGQMYAAGGEFRQNIDRAGGEGTAEFASRAIAGYCK